MGRRGKVSVRMIFHENLKILGMRKNPKVRKLFTSLRFYARVFDMVSKYHFKLSSRRMISQLFSSLNCSKEAWDILDSENDQFQLPTECLDSSSSLLLSN